jgi:cytidylate kinase
MVKGSVIICIGGMAGSGKSTIAKKLAKKYGLKYYSGGDILKTIAVEEGYHPLKRGWWESEEGMRFLQQRQEDLKYDEAVDQRLLAKAKKGNVVLDSWTMPWLLDTGFKVWLRASMKKRAQRVAKRDGINLETAVKALTNKEKDTKAIYKKLYGFNLGEDFKPFHCILDTELLSTDEVFRTICMVIDNLVLRVTNDQMTHRN